jgi:NAD+ synthase (glutamine-hydrolysing)
MKVALAQLNFTVGAIQSNCKKIVEHAIKAHDMGAQLAVFPEMAVLGYPPMDIVERNDVVDANLHCLDMIAEKAPKDLFVVVGYIDRNNDGGGKPLFNAAALLHGGKIVSRHYKSLLPYYDVFDEGRYFEPAPHARVTNIEGCRAGITICEDIWNDKDFWRDRKYAHDPMANLAAQKPELLISINASPFTVGKRQLRFQMLKNIAEKYAVPVLYVNQVGGNDSLIFDGGSAAFAPDGSRFAQAIDFEEDMILLDTETLTGDIRPLRERYIEQVHEALVLGLGDYVRKCGFKSVVLGLSGGIDSAVTAAVAARAVGPENVLGILMPSQYSSEHSVTDARKLTENLGIQHKIVPINNLFNSYIGELEEHFEGLPPDITEENIQARIRGNILMSFSNKFGRLLLSTGNKSELSVGYCTLYGDMSGGLSVISDVPKTIVYDLARYINTESELIPQNSITKPPSAELKPDQRDEDSLPPYDVLDRIVRAYVEEGKSVAEMESAGIDPETISRVLKMINRNEYKRMQAPPGLKITTKAFGYGRRIPIAAGHEYLENTPS